MMTLSYFLDGCYGPLGAQEGRHCRLRRRPVVHFEPSCSPPKLEIFCKNWRSVRNAVLVHSSNPRFSIKKCFKLFSDIVREIDSSRVICMPSESVSVVVGLIKYLTSFGRVSKAEPIQERPLS